MYVIRDKIHSACSMIKLVKFFSAPYLCYCPSAVPPHLWIFWLEFQLIPEVLEGFKVQALFRSRPLTTDWENRFFLDLALCMLKAGKRQTVDKKLEKHYCLKTQSIRISQQSWTKPERQPPSKIIQRNEDRVQSPLTFGYQDHTELILITPLLLESNVIQSQVFEINVTFRVWLFTCQRLWL